MIDIIRMHIKNRNKTREKQTRQTAPQQTFLETFQGKLRENLYANTKKI